MTDLSDAYPIFYFITFGVLGVVLGAILGSFTTAILHRVKNNKSWIVSDDASAARSACPKCHHVLAAIDLIPVLSWLSQKGRCRYCDAAISKQYLLIELFCAAATLILFLYIGLKPLLVLGVLLLPFTVAQAILFIQNRVLSKQLIIISLSIILLYFAYFYFLA